MGSLYFIMNQSKCTFIFNFVHLLCKIEWFTNSFRPTLLGTYLF